MFLRIATDFLCSGICCTIPVFLLFLLMKICRNIFRRPLRNGARITYSMLVLTVVGIFSLIQDNIFVETGISSLIRIPIVYYPDSVFSTLQPAGTDWFGIIAGICGVGILVALLIEIICSKTGRIKDDEVNALVVLNWYNPVFWMLARCCAEERAPEGKKQSENEEPLCDSADESRPKTFWRSVVIAIFGIAIFASCLFAPKFELIFREETDILSLLGAESKGVVKSDFIDVATEEHFGTPYFSADDRYSNVKGIDFLRWDYAQEIDEANVYVWMQPLEERLTQAFGMPEVGESTKGIFGNQAEKVLQWTAADDRGEVRLIRLLYVPNDAYYSAEVMGGMAVEVRLDR